MEGGGEGGTMPPRRRLISESKGGEASGYANGSEGGSRSRLADGVEEDRRGRRALLLLLLLLLLLVLVLVLLLLLLVTAWCFCLCVEASLLSSSSSCGGGWSMCVYLAAVLAVCCVCVRGGGSEVRWGKASKSGIPMAIISRSLLLSFLGEEVRGTSQIHQPRSSNAPEDGKGNLP